MREIVRRNEKKFFFSIPAVKFGRMSKKQREKVEDEVRFHRAQMRAASETAPDSSVFEHQTPSSSDQHHSYNGGSVYCISAVYKIYIYIYTERHSIYIYTLYEMYIFIILAPRLYIFGPLSPREFFFLIYVCQTRPLHNVRIGSKTISFFFNR